MLIWRQSNNNIKYSVPYPPISPAKHTAQNRTCPTVPLQLCYKTLPRNMTFQICVSTRTQLLFNKPTVRSISPVRSYKNTRLNHPQITLRTHTHTHQHISNVQIAIDDSLIPRLNIRRPKQSGVTNMHSADVADIHKNHCFPSELLVHSLKA